MAKGSLISDTFEQLAELGQSTVKQSAKSVAQTFSPIKLLEHASGKSQSTDDPGKEMIDQAKAKNNASTPLDFDKLQKNYQNQDAMKMNSLRNRLFQIVKQEDEKSLQRKKAEEQEKKRKEEYEKQEKKNQLARQQQAASAGDAPRGKSRRGVLSHKKVAERSQAEVKPSTGKQ